MNQVLGTEFSLAFVAVYEVYFQQVYNWHYKTDGNLMILSDKHFGDYSV
jgi:hypothetical protein